VMSPPPRRTGSSVFGRTLEYILAERPCRVIIEAPPAHESANGSPPTGERPRAGAHAPG
jgi:hypothetical protein